MKLERGLSHLQKISELFLSSATSGAFLFMYGALSLCAPSLLPDRSGGSEQGWKTWAF